MRLAVSLIAGLVGALTGFAQAAPILDGSGFGAPSATVAFDQGAAAGNFGAPGNTTSGAAYDIFARQDSTFIYVLLQTNGGGGTAAGTFANLYFGVGPDYHTGSTFGIEVTNQDVFTPGVVNSNVSDIGQEIYFNVLNPDAIEVAISFLYFETNPQGLGFSPVTATDPNITLRLSQSFGYSVAGGPTYGDDRLALFTLPQAAVPEPSVLALMAAALLSLLGFSALRRRA